MRKGRILLFALFVFVPCVGLAAGSNLRTSPWRLAQDDHYTVIYGNTTDLPVLSNDGVLDRRLKLVDVGVPEHGTASILVGCEFSIPERPVPVTQCIEYRPAPGYAGPDHFFYTARNAIGASASAEVTLDVVDGYRLQGRADMSVVGAPLRIGFADSGDRVAIKEDGSYTLALPLFRFAPPVLVAELNGLPVFASMPGSKYEISSPTAYVDAAVTPSEWPGLSMNAFSTAQFAALIEANSGSIPTTQQAFNGARARMDWGAVLHRNALIDAAAEAGIPTSPYELATNAVQRQAAEDRVGAAAVAQHMDAVVHSLPLRGPPVGADLLLYAPVGPVAETPLFMHFGSDGHAHYVDNAGSGEMDWSRDTAGRFILVPSSGPLTENLRLSLVGASQAPLFGAVVEGLGETFTPLTAQRTLADLFYWQDLRDSTQRLPYCANRGQAAQTLSHVFRADSTGTILETGVNFTWQVSQVLSIRYADGKLADFMLVWDDADGGAVVARVTPSGESEFLCSGREQRL